MVVLNIKTVEIIFRPRFTEPVDLNWATSNDAGDCIVKVVRFLTPKGKTIYHLHFFLLHLILKYMYNYNNRDFSLQKSVNDGMKETGGYSHVITGRNSKTTEVKGDNEVSKV